MAVFRDGLFLEWISHWLRDNSTICLTKIVVVLIATAIWSSMRMVVQVFSVTPRASSLPGKKDYAISESFVVFLMSPVVLGACLVLKAEDHFYCFP